MKKLLQDQERHLVGARLILYILISLVVAIIIGIFIIWCINVNNAPPSHYSTSPYSSYKNPYE